MNSAYSDHLSQDLIYRTLDDELSTAERFECESHLAVCEACRHKLAELHAFSTDLELAVQAIPVPDMTDARRKLQQAIEIQERPGPVLQHPGSVMRRFGWGMGLAATLAVGVLLAPRHVPGPVSNIAPVAQAPQLAPIEVDGESFVPVPYSNADLPMSAPHIVQMEVPIASLADVGIVLEPVNSRDNEGSVLADVLVGADGQPRGVHVLE